VGRKACCGCGLKEKKEGRWTWAEREEVRVGLKEMGERERMGKVLGVVLGLGLFMIFETHNIKQE
jgi:hypothetical protein